jgi:hypothetical protein
MAVRTPIVTTMIAFMIIGSTTHFTEKFTKNNSQVAYYIIMVIGQAHPGDYLGFTLQSLNLKTKEPKFVTIRPVSEITSDVLWDIFGGIIQSNSESITSSDTFEVEYTRIKCQWVKEEYVRRCITPLLKNVKPEAAL